MRSLRDLCSNTHGLLVCVIVGVTACGSARSGGSQSSEGAGQATATVRVVETTGHVAGWPTPIAPVSDELLSRFFVKMTDVPPGSVIPMDIEQLFDVIESESILAPYFQDPESIGSVQVELGLVRGDGSEADPTPAYIGYLTTGGRAECPNYGPTGPSLFECTAYVLVNAETARIVHFGEIQIVDGTTSPISDMPTFSDGVETPDLGVFPAGADLVEHVRGLGTLDNETDAAKSEGRAPGLSICAALLNESEVLAHQATAQIGDQSGVVLIIQQTDGSRLLRLVGTGQADPVTGGCPLLFEAELS